MNLLDYYDTLFYNMREKNRCFSNIIFGFLDISGNVPQAFIKDRTQRQITEIPKLSQIVKNKMGTLLWEKVPIKIADHLQFIKKKKYSERSYNYLINKLINTPLNEKKPKWKYVVVYYPQKTSLIYIGDHSYGDGHYLFSIILPYFFDKIKKIEIKKAPKRFHIIRRVVNILKSIHYFMTSLISLIYFLIFYKKKQIFSPQKRDKVCWSKIYKFDISNLKKIKEKKRITINDLIYSIVLKSIQKYTNNKNVTISSSTMFNLSNLKKELINNNNFGFIAFSTDMDDSNIFKKIHNKMNYYKKSPIIPCITNLLKALFHISCPTLIRILDNIIERNHFGYSNFHSYLKNNTIHGFPVIHISNILVPYKYDIFISVMSYGNDVSLNIAYKDGVINAKKFKKCMTEVMKEFS